MSGWQRRTLTTAWTVTRTMMTRRLGSACVALLRAGCSVRRVPPPSARTAFDQRYFDPYSIESQKQSTPSNPSAQLSCPALPSRPSASCRTARTIHLHPRSGYQPVIALNVSFTPLTLSSPSPLLPSHLHSCPQVVSLPYVSSRLPVHPVPQEARMQQTTCLPVCEMWMACHLRNGRRSQERSHDALDLVRFQRAA